MKINYFSICLMIVFLSGCINLKADDAWNLQYKYNVPDSANLRAFGTVSEKNRVYVNKSGAKIRVTEFYCENNSKASTLAGKFLADLGLSEGVSRVELALNGGTIPAKKTSAGLIFVVCTDGATARIISSDALEPISTFLNEKRELATGAVIKSSYPTFLDRFDRYGWGMYGLGDFTNLHGWMNKCEPKGKRKDPMKDLDFLVKHKIRFEPWLDPTELDNSDGIIKNTGSDWMTKAANDKGLPVSFRVYGDCGTCDWTARRFPEFVDQPAKFMMCGWHGSRAEWKSKPHMSWYSDYYHYMTVNTMKKMRLFNDNPMVMGWMYPAGEIEHDAWYEVHSDYSSVARKSWRDYLRENKIS